MKEKFRRNPKCDRDRMRKKIIKNWKTGEKNWKEKSKYVEKGTKSSIEKENKGSNKNLKK